MTDETMHPGSDDPMAQKDIDKFSEEQSEEDKEAEEWIENLPPHQKEKIGNKDFYSIALGDRLYQAASRELDGHEIGDDTEAGVILFKELLKGTPLIDLVKRGDSYKTMLKHRAGNIARIYGQTIEDGINHMFEFYTEDQKKHTVNKDTGEIESIMVPVADDIKEKHKRIKELALQKAKEIESELGEQPKE